MRKLAIALCLTATVLTALGQGTLNFSTFVGSINAPVDFAGTSVAGPDYVGQLYVSPAGGGSFEAAGPIVPFLSGAGAGYIIHGEIAAANVAAGSSADVIMRAWATASGADWGEASSNPSGIIGESNMINVAALGGAGDPPSTPPDLVGLQAFSLTQIPEPSTVALGLLGLAALALRRRK